MKPVHHHHNTWREALKIISRCPICSANYETDRAKLLAKSEAAGLVHITCQQCASSFVAMILVLGHGLSSVGMVTDLNYEDVKRLHRSAPFTIDEAIEGYSEMEAADFEERLLNQEVISIV